jgi:HK97 family phage prohead protease
MTALYADTSSAIEVCGYGSTWASVYPIEDGRYERIARGAFNMSRSISLLFAHSENFRFGSAKVWEDGHGLAFAAQMPSCWRSIPVVRGMMDGRIRAASISFRIARSRREQMGDLDVEVIERATVEEISLCDRGACPGALAWLGSADPAELAPEHRRARAHWQVGRMARRLPRPRARAQGPIPAAVAAEIDRILALPRPQAVMQARR